MAAGKTDEPAASSDIGTTCTSEDLNDSDLKPLHETNGKTFRTFDAVLVIISLITYLADTLTDILVSVEYLQSGNYIWGGLTVGLVVLPSCIIQGFSLRWYHADGKLKGCRPWLVHIFHLQPLERYLQVLVAGMEARSDSDEEKLRSYYYQQNDVCMLRLFEAFLESAPQLTLQLYIMVATNDAGWLTCVSAGVSLIAIGWGVAAYNHALRQAHKDSYRLQLPGLILQTVWHIGIVAARVCALVAFASLYKAWIFLVIGLHWILMSVWVILQNTDFCPTQAEEKLFDGIVGIIYIYCFFSLKEGQTRWRMSVFYTIMFVENVVLVAVWYPFKKEDGWTTDAIVAIVFGAFFLVALAVIFGAFSTGLACMLFYYRFCHPSGRIYCCPPSQEYSVETAETNLPRKNSGLYQLQVDLVPRTSTALLPRKAQLKPQTSLAMAAPPVIYKEVHTPSQLTPIKFQPGDHRVIDYDKTFELDSTSMFQHYSIEASQAIAISQCASIRYDGIDLTNILLNDRSRTMQTPLIEEVENPRRCVVADNAGKDSITQSMFEDDFVPCGFDHPSFSFIDGSGGSGSTSREDIDRDDSSGHGETGVRAAPEEKVMCLSEEPEMPSLSDLHFLGLHSKLDSDRSTRGTTAGPPTTPPRTKHDHISYTPKDLANFSPIREERFLNSNAGCYKFPTHLEFTPDISKLKVEPSGPRLSDFASTPCARPDMQSLSSSDSGSNDSIFVEVGKALSVKAPLASPEASLADSPSELEDSYDETMNISSYDNVPLHSAEVTVGSYLDNVSGLTYLTPPKIKPSEIIKALSRPVSIIEKLTTV